MVRQASGNSGLHVSAGGVNYIGRLYSEVNFLRYFCAPVLANKKSNDPDMNKFLFIFLFFPLSLFATEKSWQKRPWDFGGMAALNISQFTQNYWSAGGQNSTTAIGLLNVYGNYNKRNIRWENSLDLEYGIQNYWSGEIGKSNDKFELNTTLGIKKTKKVYYTALLNFRTQFTPGFSDYNINHDSYLRHTNSDFLSPAYLTMALGIDYRPKKFFSLVLSPLAGKTTVVVNQELSKEVNEGVFGVEQGKEFRTEIGWFMRTQFNADVMENVSLSTNLDLFGSYTNKPGNIDVNWDVKAIMKINDLLSANLNASLIYDDDVRTAGYKDNGTVYYRRGPRIQIKEMLGVGLCLRF